MPKNRLLSWDSLEEEIQSRAKKKDKAFHLEGKWKKFLRIENNYKVYRVDGKWVRNNLSVNFGHGGHGFVYEFIPIDEIWVSSHHLNEGKSEFSSCECKVNKKGQKLSTKYFDSTVIHEIVECEEMKKGKPFTEGHEIASNKEMEIKLIPKLYYDK